MPDTRFTDIVVLLPGIMGSTLARNGRPVWAPTAGAALTAVRTFGRSITGLTLPDGLGDEAPGPDDPGGGVQPLGLVPDLHVIPGLWTAHLGYGKLEHWLERAFGLTRVTAGGPPGNFVPFAYDWRLSIRYNGRRLAREVEDVVDRWRAQGGPYADARVRFVAHSMGGLVARWAIEREGLAPLTRQLITLATPHRGSMMAVDRLVNGIRVGWGPVTLLDLTRFARSLPGLHHLLPSYACLEEAGSLWTTGERDLPELSAARVADARALFDELDSSGGASGYRFYPLVGQKQLTATTGRIAGSTVELMPTILDGEGRPATEAGDGTVPRLSATPTWLEPIDPAVHYATDRHGSVQSNQGVLDAVEGFLTAATIVHRGPEDGRLTHLDLRVDDVLDPGAAVQVLAVPDGDARAVDAVLLDESGAVLDQVPMEPTEDGLRASFGGRPEGLYSIRVQADPGAVGQVTEVTAPFAVVGGA